MPRKNKSQADAGETEDGSGEIEFQTDKGAARSTWTAVVILLAVVGWMASGMLFDAPEDSTASDAERGAPDAPMVTVTPQQAENVTLFFEAEGQAEPDRATGMRAEVSGNVAQVMVEKGNLVVAGETVARLTSARAQAELQRAREEFDRAKREFDNASALLERGIATQDRKTQARATLAAARAQVTAAEEALEDAVITAPFEGRIETLTLDTGEYVTAGTEVGRVVDTEPLSVSIRVPQQALSDIAVGQEAQVSFITGEARKGMVTFVGSAASDDTRTFLAEVEVPNPEREIPAGISAQVRIPTGDVTAHFVQPSTISLNPDGVLGIKTVTDGRVAFNEVEVVRSQVDGLWVTGLPDRADLITIGQGYVREGEEVRSSTAPEAQQSASNLAGSQP